MSSVAWIWGASACLVVEGGVYSLSWFKQTTSMASATGTVLLKLQLSCLMTLLAAGRAGPGFRLRNRTSLTEGPRTRLRPQLA